MSETLWGVVIGGGIGVIAAVIGGIFTYRGVVRTQNETDRRERRGEASAVLGETRALIDNLAPDTWAMWGSAEVELFRSYADQWAEIRPRFIALHSPYPERSGDIESAYTSINNLRVEISLLMEAVREHRDLDKLREKAIASEQNARQLVNDLMAAVS